MPEIPFDIAGVCLFSTTRHLRATGTNTTRTIYQKIYSLEVVENQPIVKVYSNVYDQVAQDINKTYSNHWLANGNGGFYIASGLTGCRVDNNNDIDGGDSALKTLQEVDPNALLFDPNQNGVHDTYGGTSLNSTGSFLVYADGQSVSTSIAKPFERFQEQQSYIIKAKDTVDLNNITYNVLYEVDANSTNTKQELQRVFLCRDID